MKVNVDATFHEDEGMGATATVIRDEKAKILAAQCKLIPYVADVVTTEALAMMNELELANSLGFNRVEAESDSLNILKCYQGQNQWWDAAAAIFAECTDVTTSIGNVIFSHCFRDANSTAHELATFSFCNKYNNIWTEEPPGFLISQLVNDVIVI